MGLFVLSQLGNRATSSSSAGPPSDDFPAADYRLTVPKTLLDDEYALLKDESAETNEQAKQEGYGDGPGARYTQAILGTYTSTDGNADADAEADTGSGLILGGTYGQFKNPAEERAILLRSMRSADGTSEPNPPKTIRPEGSDTDLTCTVLVTEDEGLTSVIPVCAWGDDNTAAYVAFFASEDAQDPDAIDLDAAARTVQEIRDEVRQRRG
ncbi:hypothetical protein AB0O07_15380 [Streptomyces sp. NPDC093085]|uniref:hypothetical protein n=1 Tax=Streptomyces sp. NPDC093085 TaxID=3155068 RepID=UPI0034459E88